VEFSLAIDGEGRRRVIEFRDFTRSLDAVRHATEAEHGLIGLREDPIWLAALPSDPASVYVRWRGGICDLAYTVDINPTAPQVVVNEADRHACDAAGWSTAVVLTFDTPVDAERFVPKLVEGRVLPRS
jgi:hypothetical protein